MSPGLHATVSLVLFAGAAMIGGLLGAVAGKFLGRLWNYIDRRR